MLLHGLHGNWEAAQVKILVVEDSKAMVAMVKLTLEKAGHEAFSALMRPGETLTSSYATLTCLRWTGSICCER